MLRWIACYAGLAIILCVGRPCEAGPHSFSVQADVLSMVSTQLEIGDPKPTGHSSLGAALAISYALTPVLGIRGSYDIAASEFSYSNPFSRGATQSRHWDLAVCAVMLVASSRTIAVELAAGPTYGEHTSRANPLGIEVRGPSSKQVGAIFRADFVFARASAVSPVVSVEGSAYGASATDETTGSSYWWSGGGLGVGDRKSVV